PGVFHSYLNRPDLTEQVLITIPNISADKRTEGLIYRTGDLARLQLNGELLIIGRKDNQIKLRGQRIELGEIENVILSCSNDISNCIVIKINNNNKTEQDYLAAYIQLSDKKFKDKNYEATKSQIKEYCQQNLPFHMVPSYYVILEKLPLNTNEKIDRSQLPQPEFSDIIQINYIKPKTDFEKQQNTIWCKILNLKKISMNSNFFSIGGNSLSLVKLYNNYQSNFILNNNQMNISILFKHPTIAEHVKLLLNLIRKDDSEISLSKQQQWKSFNVKKGKYK
ncbi:unnamed protein product, partial [Didymodactylos carnosus]